MLPLTLKIAETRNILAQNSKGNNDNYGQARYVFLIPISIFLSRKIAKIHIIWLKFSEKKMLN
jgi:hypothetical protein